MSGNPFRRRQQQFDELPPLRTESPAEPIPSTTSSVSDRKPSKGKRVRIATPPPLSPDSIHSPIPGSSPILERSTPSTRTSYFAPPTPARIDVFAGRGGIEDDEDDNSDSEASSSLGSGTGTLASSSAENRGYVNPFERTLANIEGKYSKASTAPATVDHVNPAPRQGMDVDSFTRMLLGGPAAPTTLLLSAMPLNQSMSSTHNVKDTASQPSRISPGRPAPPSLRTSFVGSDADAEDDVLTREENDGRTKTKPPPPTPRHRHGKVVAPRAPQVVSFAEFSPTNRPAVVRQPSRDLPPTPRERSSSYINGSLLQQDQISIEKPVPFPTLTSSSSATAEAVSPTPPSSQLSVPPILPPTRTARPTRPRVDSNVSDASTDRRDSSSTIEPVQESAIGDSKNTLKTRAPPPPPMRRNAAKSPAAAAFTPSSPEPQPEQSSPGSGETPDTTHARRPSTLVPSSRSSSASIPTTNNRNIMPPPPPPRRRGSSKGSVDLTRNGSSSMANALSTGSGSERRGSGASMNSNLRRESGEMLEDVNEADDGDGMAGQQLGVEDDEARAQERKRSQDMLSDLDALQREIDALQQTHGRPG